MHWNIIVSSSGNDAMLSVTARMSRRARSCKHVFVPPHPTPPHLTPPPRIWRRCHVECGRKCVKGRNAPPGRYCPTPPASGDDAMLSVAARMSTRERSCKDIIVSPTPPHPTPPHPTQPLRIWRGSMLSVAASDADFGF